MSYVYLYKKKTGLINIFKINLFFFQIINYLSFKLELLINFKIILYLVIYIVNSKSMLGSLRRNRILHLNIEIEINSL